jgi:hypothetical protein
LKGFIDAGGDARSLDLNEVTKASLRAFVSEKAGDIPKMELVMAALRRVERQVLTWVKDDPDQARAAIEECINRLQKMHDEMPIHLQAPDLRTRAPRSGRQAKAASVQEVASAH